MIKLIKNKISQIEKERQTMSDSHRKNYQKTKNKINEYEKNIHKSDVQKHVEKELSRHF
ncbi:hypothetical protein [Staphylococcus saprophyticus]|uniref:hypothetical protein n=1 Tax=Staphylococcus saprophyticus TaxID=29385 RepID=UPI0036E10C33